MAYVPGYDHDVFISYAHVDNEETLFEGGKSIRWVTILKDELKTRLKGGLGINSVEIWMDREDLPGNESVTASLETAVCNTATMIVILSEGYKNSMWCNKEVRDFVSSAHNEGRLFIVHLQDIPLNDRPKMMQDLNGFIFFGKGGNDPLSPNSELFVNRLVDLKTSLCKKLKELKLQRTLNEDSQEHPLNTVQNSMAVLLAEGSPDLDEDLDSIRRYLDQLGYRVLPDRPYRSSAQEYKEMLDQDLLQAKLFVQLLGPWGTRRTEDFPNGLEALQLDRAKAAKLEILRAYRPDTVDFEKVKNPHRMLLQEPDVMAMDLEEFKSRIKRKLEEVRLRETMTSEGEDLEKPVIIYTNRKDEKSAKTIQRVLSTKSIASIIYFHHEPLIEKAKQLNPAGLILVYGEAAEQTWVRDRVTDFRDMRRCRKPFEPVCALYFDPPEKRDQMLISPLPPFLCDLDSNSGEDAYKEYIGKLVELRAKL